jgi:FkbM family methyltransferase
MVLYMLREIWLDRAYFFRGMEIRDGDVVVDGGANVGFFTVLAALASPHGRVIALEPVPFLTAYLRRNIGLNALTNVVVSTEGLMGRRGPLHLSIHPLNLGGHTAFPGNDTETSIRLAAHSISLSDLFDEYKLTRVDFLKLDVEGAEFPVILNSVGSVLGKIERIALEYHLGPDRRLGELVDHLVQNGYTVSTAASTDYRGFLWARRS